MVVLNIWCKWFFGELHVYLGLVCEKRQSRVSRVCYLFPYGCPDGSHNLKPNMRLLAIYSLNFCLVQLLVIEVPVLTNDSYYGY